jgi:3-hydroxyacyl-CoA dehydrogenase
VVNEIIEQFREQSGIVARYISEDEIVARTLYTMVNEGAKILEEGIAQRASDIDVVWNYGYGWPRHKGGPMFWAEQVGLDRVVGQLERYADRFEPDFTLSELLKARAATGGFDW